MPRSFFLYSSHLIIAMHSPLLPRLLARISRRTIATALDYRNQHYYSTIYAYERYKTTKWRSNSILPTSIRAQWMPVLLHTRVQRSYASLPVDTYRLVTQLESRGFTRKQAEIIMKAMCGLLTHSDSEARRILLDKDDLENETYLFRAALDELRMEIEVLRRTDQATLKAESDAISRRLMSYYATLRQENQALMNTRRLDQRSDEKEMDMRIHELNDLLMVKLGEVRTEVEAMKMGATRNAMGNTLIQLPMQICIDIYYVIL
ncbi:hypothetical protein BDF22DRAFT_678531 [Syncephalis plumigaleata]|nr:hypothetical protein BDF22DRAFT_678531 [Syncephalis plumigaleata]